ncbi:MAG: class I SAM-dependent methyltransferase [Gemmatimonadaceae bacterium]
MSSYETSPEFGAMYDAVPAYAERPDVPFYLAEAARAGRGSRVLEVGCGTGRISLPLARAGHAVTGVDLSPAMLARAREKLAAEPEAVRARVALVEGDATRLDVPGGPFDLAIAPFRVLQHLTDVDDQLRCLTSVRRHLAPGGRLAFDVFNPSFASMVGDRSAEVEDTPELTLPDGRHLRRTVRVPQVHFVEQVSDIEIAYYLRTGSATRRVVQAFRMRWYTPRELEHLLARAGYQVEAMYGGFDRRPLTDGAPEIVVVAGIAATSRGVGLG